MIKGITVSEIPSTPSNKQENAPFFNCGLKLETYFSIRIPWYTKDLMHKINFNLLA